ncbi:MAG TPA: hypothetical protein VFS05_00415, partial [Gemmatimonadaceae bacterium]|nr:hypothetical protein [Gemmatimonadaceae bacterium]
MLQRIRRVITVKRAVLLVLAALALAGIGAALRPGAIEVETAVVRRAPLRVTVNAEGMTRVRD